MASYQIDWDGETVTLPPAGPDGGRHRRERGLSWFRVPYQGKNAHLRGPYDLRLIGYAETMFRAHGKVEGTISVPLVLIPRPDNPYDSDAVSVALPRSMGGDAEARCLGYLYQYMYESWGIANDERRDLVARLAAFSFDGEVQFTGILDREDPLTPLAELDTTDDLEVSFALPELSLDLPGARIMGPAIRDFLAEHERGMYGYDVQDLDRR